MNLNKIAKSEWEGGNCNIIKYNKERLTSAAATFLVYYYHYSALSFGKKKIIINER